MAKHAAPWSPARLIVDTAEDASAAPRALRLEHAAIRRSLLLPWWSW